MIEGITNYYNASIAGIQVDGWQLELLKLNIGTVWPGLYINSVKFKDSDKFGDSYSTEGRAAVRCLDRWEAFHDLTLLEFEPEVIDFVFVLHRNHIECEACADSFEDEGECPVCKGNGFIYLSEKHHAALVLWTITPQIGCSTIYMINELRQEDIPTIINFLNEEYNLIEKRFEPIRNAT